MTSKNDTQAWLHRVRHDLVKRVLWVARDCRSLDRAPLPGSLMTQCVDDEGRTVSALDCWQALCEDAPHRLDLTEFDLVLRQSVVAAEQDDLDGVLALEAAFERLLTQAE